MDTVIMQTWDGMTPDQVNRAKRCADLQKR